MRVTSWMGWFLLGACLAAPAAARAQEGDTLENLSLEELLETPVTSASSSVHTLRDTPAVVTVVTHEEIMASGARDLQDVLRLVPGFDLGLDSQAVVGLGFRGNWGHEGKILLLIDGLELNEDLYGTLQLGNHYPVEQFETVEVIRGPGSTMFGGNAELAVISITTRGAARMKGARAGVLLGQQQRHWARRDVSLEWGLEVPRTDGLLLNVAGFVGQGNRSDRVYTDQVGQQVDMRDNAFRTDPAYLNASAQWKGWTARLLADDYRMPTRDGLDVLRAEPYVVDFQTLILDLRGAFRLWDLVTLTPRVSYKRGASWRVQDQASDMFYAAAVDRVTARLSAVWDLPQSASVLTGAEASVQRAFLQEGPLTGAQTGFKGGRQDVQYGNLAAFAELNVENFLGSLVAGVRAEHHSGFGTSVVPRLTWTKVLDPFHFKLLFSRAFRAPSVENIELSQDIKAELATSMEAEMGLRVGDHAFLSLNVFDNVISRPIIYGTVGDEEYYLNRERAGSRGVEADFKLQGKWGGVDLNYAYYNAVGRNLVENYAVPDRPSVTLAFPAHKFNVISHFHLAPGVTLTPSATLLSERYADVSRDADGNPVVARFRPMLLLNVFLWARDVGVRGLNAGLGMYNILDEPDVLIQPYHGGHAPLPAASREVVFRLSYGVEQ